MAKIRKLTVCCRFVSHKYGKDSEVPVLTLLGKWLDEAGFNIGSKVEVECKDDELIIRRVGNRSDGESE